MITNKQLKANKENAIKWGIKTEEWKNISKYNTYNHWLTANKLLDERERIKYQLLLEELKDEFDISWFMEDILVERIAFYYIKIHKASEIEEKYSYFESISNMLKRRQRLEDIELGTWTKVNLLLKEAVEKQEEILEIHNIDDLLKIQRYTTSAENRLYKAIKELIKIKKMKNPNFDMSKNGFVLKL